MGKTIRRRLILLLCAFASPLWAEVGTVEQVENGVIIRGGTTITAEVGDDVEQGDILQTVPSGLMHVRMIDNTRFVVGQGTTISIDTALIGGDPTKFESLAVGVTVGVFRFLSGDSEKSAYGVNTPVATMGIRGTHFDVVHDNIDTHVVVLEGEVDFCALDTNQCITVFAGCTVASTEEEEAKINDDQALDQFDLLQDQEPLLDDFKAITVACGNRIPQNEAALDLAPGPTETALAGGGAALAAAAAAAFLAIGLEIVNDDGVHVVPNHTPADPPGE